MVLKKRQYCGFTDFHVPSVPRAPRSARGRGLHKKKVNDGQICAFELLASLAGKLLQESESSASSNATEANVKLARGSDSFIKRERDEDLPLKTEFRDRGSCEESASIPEFESPRRDKKCILEELSHAENDSVPENSSIISNSDSLDKVRSDLKPVICKRKITSENFPGKLEHSPDSAEFSNCIRQQRADKLETGGSVVKNYHSLKNSADLCTKNPALVNSDMNYKLSSRRSAIHGTSVMGHRSGVKLGVRYDDEKFSRLNRTNNKSKAYRLPSRVADQRRIRKLLTSKYWKAGPKLKDYELLKDDDMKPLYHKRKMCYGRERYHQDALHKRRKLSASRLVVTSDGGFSCESVCNSPEKGVNAEKNGSAAVFHGANEVSSPVMDHHMPFHPEDCHVKLSIKSIRVPELFIEVPETTTVGSLKRIVMDTLTTILGDGLRVGVALHGKKVRDDNRTLLQTGIACKENLDSLGFILEPTPVVQASSPLVCTENAPGLQCATSQLVLRSPATPALDSGIPEAVPEPSLPFDLGNNTENNHNSESSQTCLSTDITTHPDSKALVAVPPISSHANIVTEETHPDSKALVTIPPVNAQALAMVPAIPKSKRVELVQRRTRRPFSVSEVEALVQAVEELGTGRWRDVKLRSFETADHRTYVDLKDKWKTLVHTAKISPQQRRGEPVPQELLDRVLAAHAYWSQHQVKQHNKNQTAKTTEAPAARKNGN